MLGDECLRSASVVTNMNELSRGALNRLLNCIAATWCGAALLLVGFYSVYATGIIVADIANSVETGDIGGTIGAVSDLVVGIPLAWLFALAFGRFLSRVLPPGLDERRYARAYLAVGIVLLVISLQAWLLLVASSPESITMTPISEASRRQWLITAIPPSIWAVGALGPLWRRYARVDAVLRAPFVLFLRRFSTFSDRAVVSLVLREVRSGTPVVFLTATHSQARDWNPFVVGFSGLKMRHPLRSTPMVLRVPDAEWRTAAARLIDSATTIVLDISELSDAMRTETQMIGERARWSATVCLRSLGAAGAREWAVPAEARVIDYGKSWRAAIPKLLIGALLGLGSGLMLYIFFLISLGQLTLRVFGDREPLLISVVVVSVLLSLTATVSAYAGIFALPTIDRHARAAIRQALGGRVRS